MKQTFLIGPVRGVSENALDEIVSKLESQGWDVYQPARDTTQTGDPTGFRICQDNKSAIISRDTVHIVWDGKSMGSLFDLGIAFALDKKIIVVALPPLTKGKSFQNMIAEWSKRCE